jgi:predicted nucleic acid-binding protein
MAIKPIFPDINVLILALSGQEPYAFFFKKLIREKRLILSVIVIAEFLTKAAPEEEKIFLGLVEKFPVAPIDLATAQIAAYYRKTYKKKKLLLPDCLLAASVKTYRGVLATLDQKDYPIKEIEIITVFT